MLKARRDAEALGMSPALAESILQSLIRGSLTTQEQARVAAQGAGRAAPLWSSGAAARWAAGRRISWRRRDFAVTIADPAGEVPGYEWVATGRRPDSITT